MTSISFLKMTLQPVLPNELMLMILKHQTTISDLLALSSTNRSMRSLFLDDASGILTAVCKKTNLLSAAKILVDVISEVANDQPQACVCKPPDEPHFHKNVANQHYIADGLAPYPTELRDLRTISRTVNVSMLVANKAIDFWIDRAARCQVDHEASKVDKDKFAQAYILLWVCAESHFSSKLESRARKLGSELFHREMILLRQLYEYASFDLDRPTKLQIGNADPEHNEEDIEMESRWFRLIDRGDRTDYAMEYETNNMEWWFWLPQMHLTFSNVWPPFAIVTEWEGDKPVECWCPTVTWIKWDLVHMNWRHTWDRMA